MSPRHRFVVSAELAGTRLDRYLAEQQPGWSRSRARRLIDDQRVTHNGRPAKPATVVRDGDLLEVDEPPPQPIDVAAEDIPLDIIFEDPDLLVLDKPADLVIHPAAGNPSGTLVNALLHHCQDLSGIGGYERPGIVHRLDKGTTGLLIVAKSDRAHLRLALAFRRREVHKTYLAVCYGIPSPTEGTIDAAIGRHPGDRQRMAIRPGGRPARTLYSVSERHAWTSLVRCQPITGRTHQIRVHMAHVGYALVGDPIYAGKQWRGLREPAATVACRSFPRQALHAWRLAFDHPVSGQAMTFEAPLPDDLRELLAVLRSGPIEAPMTLSSQPLKIADVASIPPQGLRFSYQDGPLEEEGILLRLASGEVVAYKNECRHVPMRLDAREPRTLWDARGLHLVCCSHGARYRVGDGLCVKGPCEGARLVRLPIVVRDGEVFVDGLVLLPPSR